MKLCFPWTEIEKALDEIKTAKEAQPLYGEKTGKGFWLVGDEGVYIMPNTKDGKYNKKHKKPFAVYATQCNPKTLDFEIWWKNKQLSFGRDDGCEFLGISDIQDMRNNTPEPSLNPEYLVIEIEPDNTELAISII